MIKKLQPVTLEEFEILLYFAQQTHLVKKEPIPIALENEFSAIETCLLSPFRTFLEKDLYPTLTDKATHLFFLLIKNHPLRNGNKRMACLCLFYFFEKNGIKYKDELIQWDILALRVSRSTNENSAKRLIKRSSDIAIIGNK